MVLLQIPLSEFWDYTPIEIDYALKNNQYEDKKVFIIGVKCGYDIRCGCSGGSRTGVSRTRR